MTTAPTAIHSGNIQRRLRAWYPSDPRIMQAAPTQFRRAVVIGHFQQTRPLLAEKLAHLWQRETGHSVRHSDIQFVTISSKLAHSWQRASPTCGREKPTQRFRQSDIQFGTREQSQQLWYGMRRRFLVLRGQVPSKVFGSFRSPPAADFFSGFGSLSQ